MSHPEELPATLVSDLVARLNGEEPDPGVFHHTAVCGSRLTLKPTRAGVVTLVPSPGFSVMVERDGVRCVMDLVLHDHQVLDPSEDPQEPA